MNTVRALALCCALVTGAALAAEPAVQAPPAAAAPAATAPAAQAAGAPVMAAPSTPAAQSPAAPVAVTTAPSSAGSLVQVIFGLLIVLGLLAGAMWFLKRLGGGRFAPGSVVKIIGGVSVGNRERVMVVEVADQWIVIGVAPGQVNTLATLPRQEHATPGTAAAAPNFSAWLKQTIEKRNAN